MFQAYQILSILKEERPDDLAPAWEDLVGRGPRWKRYAEGGLEDMEKRFGSKVIDKLFDHR